MLDDDPSRALEGMPPMESLFAEPVKLMAKVPEAMERALRLYLSSWNAWPVGADSEQQQIAERLIEEIMRSAGE